MKKRFIKRLSCLLAGAMAVTSLNAAVFAASADTGEVADEKVVKERASDWVPLDDIEGLADISARGFVIRHLDADGNVVNDQVKSFTVDQMKEMTGKDSDYIPSYYTYGCTQLTYPSISKAEGVKLSTLLEKAGISFGEGQVLKLRTTDRLAEELDYGKADADGNLDMSDEERTAWINELSDPGTIDKDAVYTDFTYEYLIKTPRFSFAEGMAEAILQNPEMTQNELYTDANVIASAVSVEPMLCFGFGQIYVDEIKDSSTVQDIPMTRKDAYRFCFGQAMDEETDTISTANTRRQTAYNVFGIDIVDEE